MGVCSDRFFLRQEDTLIVVVDVQERLCVAMDQEGLSRLVKNASILLETASELGIPVAVTEQYVKGLGETLPELVAKLDAVPRHEKMSFSCCGCDDFMAQIKASGRRQIVLTGMETHVCVLQTALELLDAGYVVHLVADAVISRSNENRQVALAMMQQAGAVVTCTETVLFQLLRVAGGEAFKKLSKLVR